MRTRDEIEKESQRLYDHVSVKDKNSLAILEVLLDIRDLLSEQKQA